MSAPLVWIFLPAGAAFGLFLSGRYTRAATLLGMAAAGLLALAAWLLPLGEVIALGSWSGQIAETVIFFGRRVALSQADKPVLIFIYASVAFWLGGALPARTPRNFPAVSLGAAALLTAVLSVEPFLYAALLIELVALISVSVLTVPGKPVGAGVLRFLTFQTLGMPCLLLAGWILSRLDAGAASPEIFFQAGVLLAIGFAFWLAVFPFHSWLPMLMEEAHPYAAAFVFYILTLVVFLFGMSFFDRYPGLRSSPEVYAALRAAGVLMVAVGGGFAAFQRHLGRLLGFMVLVETGYAILALSLSSILGPQLFFASLLARGVGSGVWALSLAILRNQTGDLRFSTVQGAARSLPLAAIGVLAAHFSALGFPLLAAFPYRLALWQQLAAESLGQTAWIFAGTLGLLFSGLRSLAVLTMGPENPPRPPALGLWARASLAIGITALFVVGILPHWFLPGLLSLQQAFSYLNP
jgi:formate hydrogenlyase subunit 3/multisubunit Na+/H+ antiporter MnhD subunit